MKCLKGFHIVFKSEKKKKKKNNVLLHIHNMLGSFTLRPVS